MGKNPEQLNNPDRIGSEPPELHEKDECNRCGNLYDSPNSCVECAARPEKKKYEGAGEDRMWAKAMESARKSQKGRPEDIKYLHALAKVYYNQEKAKQNKDEAIRRKRNKK